MSTVIIRTGCVSQRSLCTRVFAKASFRWCTYGMAEDTDTILLGQLLTTATDVKYTQHPLMLDTSYIMEHFGIYKDSVHFNSPHPHPLILPRIALGDEINYVFKLKSTFLVFLYCFFCLQSDTSAIPGPKYQNF